MSHGKAMKIRLIAQLIKKTLYKMRKYFPKPYEPFVGDINVKVGLLDYATIADRKKTIEADISNLPSKSNLAILKAKINEIEVG